MDDLTSTIVMSIITGIISGVISSLTVWWLLTHYFSPKIEISSGISKYMQERKKCGYHYQIKFLNKRKRLAVNLHLSSHMVLPSLIKEGVNEIWSVPLFTTEIPALLSTFNNAKCISRRLGFNIENDDFNSKFDRPDLFPEHFIKLVKDKTVSLDDILAVHPKSFIRVVISATDSLTGSTRVFVSRDFSSSDIMLGRFKKGSVEIEPSPTSKEDSEEADT